MFVGVLLAAQQHPSSILDWSLGCFGGDGGTSSDPSRDLSQSKLASCPLVCENLQRRDLLEKGPWPCSRGSRVADKASQLIAEVLQTQ